MMNPDPERNEETDVPGDLHDVELNRQLTTTQGQGCQIDEGILDHVFNSAEHVCCGIGSKQADTLETNGDVEAAKVDLALNAPEAPESEGELDSEKEASVDEEQRAVKELSPDDDFALGLESDVENESNHSAHGDPSAVKEAVEIQAHFDEEEDGLTITSDNGQDTTMESGDIGMFLGDESDKKNKSNAEPRRRKLFVALAVLFAVILVIGLSVGLATKNKDEEKSLSKSAATGTGSETDNTGGTDMGSTSDELADSDSDAAVDGPEAAESVTVAPVSSTDAPIASTDVPVSSTDAPIASTDVPVSSSDAPIASTDVPVSSTDAPIASTDVPVSSSDAPVVTEPPADAADVSTTAPTSVTTTCDSISVDASCYGFFRDDVIVSFSICDANTMDWVAIYPEGTDMSGVESPRLEWNYSCGDQNCGDIVSTNTVNMNNRTPPGRYQAYLFSNAGGDQGAPYVAIAASEVFEVTTAVCD